MNSPYTFERLATNANGNDSVITLLLTVVPNVVSVYNESICPDEVYVGHGFSESTTGTYVHHYVSSSGCDSTITLNLTVNPAYTVNDARTIMTSEMPYTYLDTVFNDLTMLGNSVHVIRHKTEAGCDSIVTLTLTVYNDVSLADVLNDVFEIYPNPIAQYEEVIINANLNELEIDGMVLEVFKSSGERVKVLHVQELPVRVDGFDASGLYVIRITTASNKVIYGKIVVK